MPIYYNNLNWACDSNFLFYTNTDPNNTNVINQTLVASVTCGEAEKQLGHNKTFDCHNLFENYYCNVGDAKVNLDDQSKLKEYSLWEQCYALVTTILGMYTLCSFLLHVLHKWKTKSTQGYSGPKKFY